MRTANPLRESWHCRAESLRLTGYENIDLMLIIYLVLSFAFHTILALYQMKLIILTLAISAKGLLPGRGEIPSVLYDGPRDPVPLNHFWPANVAKNSKKSPIPFGTSEDPKDAWIDAIPVVVRLQTIARFRDCSTRSIVDEICSVSSIGDGISIQLRSTQSLS